MLYVVYLDIDDWLRLGKRYGILKVQVCFQVEEYVFGFIVVVFIVDELYDGLFFSYFWFECFKEVIYVVRKLVRLFRLEDVECVIVMDCIIGWFWWYVVLFV